MKTQIVVLVAVFVVAKSAWAYMDGYAPFTPEHKPKPFPVRELKCAPDLSSEEEQVWISETPGKPDIRVRLLDLPEKGGALSIHDAAGNKLAEKMEVPYFGTRGEVVYEGFFNEDKKPDYVIRTSTNGCGLASCYSYVYFLLSTKDAYCAVALYLPCFGSDDLVDVNDDGRLEYIHTAFIRGVHNYWAHNLLHFEGDKVVSANRLDWRFPCWVWYTDKENHKNTTKLTKEEKKKFWLEEAPNLFPGAEKFADEQ